MFLIILVQSYEFYRKNCRRPNLNLLNSCKERLKQDMSTNKLVDLLNKSYVYYMT